MAGKFPKIEYGSPTTTIEFDVPPQGFDVFGTDERQFGRTKRSKSGKVQFVNDYQEKKYTFTKSEFLQLQI